MIRLAPFVTLMAAVLTSRASAQDEADPSRGGALYRNCVACHAPDPEAHLSGPSLAGVFGRKAGTAEEFRRYFIGPKGCRL